jgi:N-acetyl-anhydromuramyl-L-alanine amidase AmpD
VDAKGYIEGAGLVHNPVVALERGELDGPHAIVLHRTVSSTASSTIAAFERGVGTHFVIDKDGTIYQTASLNKKTAHVGPIRSRCFEENTCSPAEAAEISRYGVKQGHNHEKSKRYPERYPMNEDSVGIEVVAMYHQETAQWDAPTPAQKESISRLVGLLKSNYSMTDADVYEHDKISRKTAGEGAGLYDVNDSVPARFPPPFF